MARVTVEDALSQIPNRFILANIAAKRTKQLSTGAKPTIVGYDSKPSVLALREVEEGTVRIATEEEAVVIREEQSKPKVKKRFSGEELNIEDAIPSFTGDTGSDNKNLKKEI